MRGYGSTDKGVGMNIRKHWLFDTTLSEADCQRLFISTVQGKGKGGQWEITRSVSGDGLEIIVAVFEIGMLMTLTQSRRHAAGNEIAFGVYPSEVVPGRNTAEMWMTRRKSVMHFATAGEPAVKQRFRAVRRAFQQADPSVAVSSG